MAATDMIDGTAAVHGRTAALFAVAWRTFPMRLPRPRSQRQRDRAIALVNAAFLLLISALVATGVEVRANAGAASPKQAAPVMLVVTERALR